MNNLKEALRQVSNRIAKEGKLTGDLALANGKAADLFNNPNQVIVTTNRGRQNITLLSLFRVNRYLRRNGIDWPVFDWNALLEWIYANWQTILKILLSLLVFI